MIVHLQGGAKTGNADVEATVFGERFGQVHARSRHHHEEREGEEEEEEDDEEEERRHFGHGVAVEGFVQDEVNELHVWLES